jgi:hypothetical protein
MTTTLVQDREGRIPSLPSHYSVRSTSLLPKYEAARSPVEVRGDSINYNVEKMEINRFYLAVLKGEPYLFRKVSDHEVEIYGMAE